MVGRLCCSNNMHVWRQIAINIYAVPLLCVCECVSVCCVRVKGRGVGYNLDAHDFLVSGKWLALEEGSFANKEKNIVFF